MYSTYRSTTSMITDNNDENIEEMCNDELEELKIAEYKKEAEDLIDISHQFTNLLSVEIDFPKIKESTEDKNRNLEGEINSDESKVDVVLPEKTNSKKKSTKFKDGLSQHFEDAHIRGIHKPKRRNHKANFHKTKYKSVLKIERAKGKLPHQILMITRGKLNFEETGSFNHGEKGQGHFLVAGTKHGKRCNPQHVVGQLFERPDGTFEDDYGGGFQIYPGSDTAEYSGYESNKDTFDHNNEIFSLQEEEYFKNENIISIKNDKETSDDWSDGSNVYPQQTTSEEQVKSIDDQNLVLQRYENSWTDVENESDSSDNNENYYSESFQKRRNNFQSKRALKKENQMLKAIQKDFCELALKDGKYVEYFMKEKLKALLDRALHKIISDRDKFVLPLIPGERKSLTISLNIKCTFKSNQFPTLTDENIFSTSFSHWDSNNSTIHLDMYPLHNFERETRVLLDTFEECYRNKNLDYFGSAEIDCSKIDGTMKLKHILNPKNPRSGPLQTIHEHFMDILKIKYSNQKVLVCSTNNSIGPSKEMLLKMETRMKQIHLHEWASKMLKINKRMKKRLKQEKEERKRKKKRIIHNLPKKRITKLVNNPIQCKYLFFYKKGRKTHARVRFHWPESAIFCGDQEIGLYSRNGPGEVKFNKFGKYEAISHREGCEKINDYLCLEPRVGTTTDIKTSFTKI